MIKYSSCSNHLWFLPCCHQNNILLRDLHVKSRIMSEKNPPFYNTLANCCWKDEQIRIIHVRLKNRNKKLRLKNKELKIKESLTLVKFQFLERIH